MKTSVRNILSLLLILSPVGLYAQEETIHIPIPPDWKQNTVRDYDGTSLFGYMDGGAELYLEYGFEHLQVIEIEAAGQSFSVQLYRMKTDSAAFGIFSVNSFGCKGNNVLTRYDCSTPYQYQAVLGRYYLSVVNQAGTPEAMNTGKHIATAFLQSIHEQPFILPELFNDSLYKPSLPQMKFACGVLGMQNGYPDWAPAFETLSGFTAFILPLQDMQATIALICLSDSKERERLAEQMKMTLQESAGHLYFYEQGETTLVILAGDPTKNVKGTLERLIHYKKSLLSE